MISNEQIRQTINDCSKAGHSVGMRDISYILLCKHYEDKATAYRILFGLDADFNADYVLVYDQTVSINYLREYVERNLIETLTAKKKKKLTAEEDISFEENKGAMIKLIRETQEAMDRGEIEAKDGLKIQADLRVKLNNVFEVKEDVRDQIVIVQNKFSSICSHCGHECAPEPISKEKAMELYDLVEK